MPRVTTEANSRYQTILLTAEEEPDLAMKYSQDKHELEGSEISVNEESLLKSDYDDRNR